MNKIFPVISVLAISLLCAFNASAQKISLLAEGDDDGIFASKTARNNYDGTYTLELEAFAKGSNITTTIEKPVPIDAVLILDVSGSMGWDMDVVSYTGSSFNLSNCYNANYNNDYFLRYGDNYLPFTLERVQTVGGGYSRNREYVLTGTVTVNGVDRTIKFNGSSNNYGASVSWTPGTDDISALFSDTTLYQQATSSVSKMKALQDACKTFADNIYADYQKWADTDTPVTHRISIVTFSTNSNTPLTLAQGEIKEGYNSTTNANSFYSKINALSANGGTQAQLGFQAALSQVNLARNKVDDVDVAKVVVFFTDGNPGQSGTWEETRGSNGDKQGHEVAYKAINYSKQIKDKGATVYSVTVLDLYPDGETQKAYRYMNLLSSAYPNAECVGGKEATGTGGNRTYSEFACWENAYPASTPDTVNENKYFSKATNSEALKQVFKSISEDVSGGSVTQLGAETQIRDIISSDFSLPVGAEKENVRIFTQNLVSVDASGNCTFDPSSENELDKNGLSWRTEGGQQVVQVTNFDFTEHWCGLDEGEPHEGGQKLILRIIIVPSPDSDGGLLRTNAEASGIYVKDKDGNYYRTKPFAVPDPVYTDRAMTLTKTGMEAGETVIFVVTNEQTNQIWTVIAIAGSDGVATVNVKVPVTYFEDSTEKFYSYSIIEKNDWSWNYEDTIGYSAQELYKAVAGSSEREQNFNFSFTAEDNSKKVLHGSAAAENRFEYNGPVVSTPSVTNPAD